MFREESLWVKDCIMQLPAAVGNKLVGNLGSSTGYFRKTIQPHIQQNIFDTLDDLGWHTMHIDIKKDEGIDIAADLTDINFTTELTHRFALTICTNMLEHVESIPLVINNLFAVTSPGGYLLITVPYKYPIHHDPIDNGLRPTPQEIMNLFPSGTVEKVAGHIIIINDKEYYKIKKSRLPLWGYRERIKYYLGKRFKVSGILLKKVV